MKRTLPKEKHFCTSSGLEGTKEWGQLIKVKDHTLACVVCSQPSVSKTHGFVSVFALQKEARSVLGPVIANLRPVVPQETGVMDASVTWARAPHYGEDLEQLCGFFPKKLFSSRADQ